MQLALPEWEQECDVALEEETTAHYSLIVWNDDVNTFDHVIDVLMKVCKHTKEQAEQCSLLIHYKGKAQVKIGALETLRKMAEAILEQGIQATVE